MFETPRYIHNSFSVVFPRQPTIRRRVNEFEDKLREQYVQPLIIPIPDDLDPDVPRMLFGSRRGFSQIIISQVRFVLNVTYSPDWQEDISRGRQYLLERVPILFDLLEILGETKPYFCGLMTLVRLPSKMDTDAILDYMVKLFLKNADVHEFHDIQLKTTTVVSNHFFSNITLRNYQMWKHEGTQQDIPRFSQKETLERGIEIEGDFNDRYKFNEDINYFSGQDGVEEIIDNAFSEMEKAIRRVKERSYE